LDEAKSAKRKYNGGRKIEGQWIFGALKGDNPSRYFTLQYRTARKKKEKKKTLIKERFLPGIIIMSDSW